MGNVLLFLVVAAGVVSVGAGLGGVLVETAPKAPPTELQKCEAKAVPSSYLLGDQLLHRMQVEKCLRRRH